jgi:hypothetical protein
MGGTLSRRRCPAFPSAGCRASHIAHPCAALMARSQVDPGLARRIRRVPSDTAYVEPRGVRADSDLYKDCTAAEAGDLQPIVFGERAARKRCLVSAAGTGCGCPCRRAEPAGHAPAVRTLSHGAELGDESAWSSSSGEGADFRLSPRCAWASGQSFGRGAERPSRGILSMGSDGRTAASAAWSSGPRWRVGDETRVLV